MPSHLPIFVLRKQPAETMPRRRIRERNKRRPARRVVDVIIVKLYRLTLQRP